MTGCSVQGSFLLYFTEGPVLMPNSCHFLNQYQLPTIVSSEHAPLRRLHCKIAFLLKRKISQSKYNPDHQCGKSKSAIRYLCNFSGSGSVSKIGLDPIPLLAWIRFIWLVLDSDPYRYSFYCITADYNITIRTVHALCRERKGPVQIYIFLEQQPGVIDPSYRPVSSTSASGLEQWAQSRPGPSVAFRPGCPHLSRFKNTLVHWFYLIQAAQAPGLPILVAQVSSLPFLGGSVSCS